MFKLTLSDADLLKNSIPIISEIIDEAVFKVDENGISLVSPDRAMVAVVDMKIMPTAFDEYKCEGEELLGLNLSNLSAVIKRAKSGDKIILEKEKDDNKLTITIKGEGTRKFVLPLLDIKTEKPPIDKLAFTGRLEIESKIIEESIADADIISDAVIFEADGNAFRIEAKGDVSSVKMELTKEDKGLLDLKVDGTIRAQYPLEYLKKMIKASKISEQMTIEFGTDYPMRMGFKSIDKMQLSFILAPRVES